MIACAIATLVERSTGYAMLVALPEGYKPEQVAPALASKIQTLPDSLRRTLTWDQGPEMRDWKQIRVASGIEVYFCDPHAPWQRGTNENTNGLLRQYFPKGFDFTTITETDLDAVADELNDRPRKRLDFYKPSERIAELCGLHPAMPQEGAPERASAGRSVSARGCRPTAMDGRRNGHGRNGDQVTVASTARIRRSSYEHRPPVPRLPGNTGG